jgi:uncharacterized phiE125 gp8 family phage protein
VDEVRAHSRIDDTEEDAVLIETYIAAARWMAEMIADRQIMPATWKLYLDAFPAEIHLPKPHCQSVASVTYTDPNGTTQTLSSSLYAMNTVAEPAILIPAYGQSWPATRDVMNAVCVTYVAGYGAGDDDADTANAMAIEAMPKNLKLGMLHLVKTWFDVRGPDEIEFRVENLEVPSFAQGLIRSCWHGW